MSEGVAACPGARSSCSLRQGRARHSSPSPDRCRYQSRRRRGPGISGKMFSAPGLLARVERSGGRVRWRPKRSCCPWTPTISTAALLDTQRQRRVLGRERAGRVWATLASTSTRDGQPFKAHPQGWLMYVVHNDTDWPVLVASVAGVEVGKLVPPHSTWQVRSWNEMSYSFAGRMV